MYVSGFISGLVAAAPVSANITLVHPPLFIDYFVFIMNSLTAKKLTNWMLKYAIWDNDGNHSITKWFPLEGTLKII